MVSFIKIFNDCDWWEARRYRFPPLIALNVINLKTMFCYKLGHLCDQLAKQLTPQFYNYDEIKKTLDSAADPGW